MKNLVISNAMRSAIKSAAESLGSHVELGRVTGVNPVYIGRYISGINKKMSNEIFLRLIPAIESFLPAKSTKSLHTQAVPAVKVYWNEDIAYFARQIIGAKIGTGCACWISERAYAQRTPEQEKIPITLSRAMLYVLMIIQDYELEVEGR